MTNETLELSESDINFLVALHASEEAGIQELFTVLQDWKVPYDRTWLKLGEFYNDGLIIFFARIGRPESLVDFTSEETSEFLTRRVIPQHWYTPCLGLTDKGWTRWQVDDWGVTTKRARFLTFTNSAKSRK